jgi:hypothetical protein
MNYAYSSKRPSVRDFGENMLEGTRVKPEIATEYAHRLSLGNLRSLLTVY